MVRLSVRPPRWGAGHAMKGVVPIEEAFYWPLNPLYEVKNGAGRNCTAGKISPLVLAFVAPSAVALVAHNGAGRGQGAARDARVWKETQRRGVSRLLIYIQQKQGTERVLGGSMKAEGGWGGVGVFSARGAVFVFLIQPCFPRGESLGQWFLTFTRVSSRHDCHGAHRSPLLSGGSLWSLVILFLL